MPDYIIIIEIFIDIEDLLIAAFVYCNSCHETNLVFVDHINVVPVIFSGRKNPATDMNYTISYCLHSFPQWYEE